MVTCDGALSLISIGPPCPHYVFSLDLVIGPGPVFYSNPILASRTW